MYQRKEKKMRVAMKTYSTRLEVVFIESEESCEKTYWPWSPEAEWVYKLLGYDEEQPVDEAKLELISGAMKLLGVKFRVTETSLKSY